MVYLSHEDIRAGQFLTILTDRLSAIDARCIVLDGAANMMTGPMPAEEFRHLLDNLVIRFKKLDVTSLITIEARALFLVDSATELGLSAVADNLLMLRYASVGSQLIPTLNVVKTRGGSHDRRTHSLIIGKGGLSIGSPMIDVRQHAGPHPAGGRSPDDVGVRK